MADPNAVKKHVTIKLLKVKCSDTETITGADKFYVVGGAATGFRYTESGDVDMATGGASSGDTSSRKAHEVLTQAFKINDNEEKEFYHELKDPKQAVIFDDDVSAEDYIELNLSFYDQDATISSSEFQKEYSGTVSAIGKAIALAVDAIPAPVPGKSLIAQKIGEAAPKAFFSVWKLLDRDDRLGVEQKRVEVNEDGQKTYTCKLAEPGWQQGKKHDWYSGWEYEVTYTVDVGPAQ